MCVETGHMDGGYGQPGGGAERDSGDAIGQRGCENLAERKHG